MNKIFRNKAEITFKLFQIRILNDSLFSIYKSKTLRNSAIAPVIEKNLIKKRERVSHLTQEMFLEMVKNSLTGTHSNSEKQIKINKFAKGA